VFNLELNEGLAESHFTGLDADPFDGVCDHLIVEHLPTGNVVGTYRLQTGARARDNIGYYSEREFCFRPYEALRAQIIELGRACVHAEHRSFQVLHLLWRGIAHYARDHSARFLIGCSSLSSTDPADGGAVYHELSKKYLAARELRTLPQDGFVLAGVEHPAVEKPGSSPPATVAPSSKLLRAYLMIGARICGPPALDREFGTIDFLTLLDLEALPGIVQSHFFR
jgi:putative hemolysin